jgi:hypothetical protein
MDDLIKQLLDAQDSKRITRPPVWEQKQLELNAQGSLMERVKRKAEETRKAKKIE